MQRADLTGFIDLPQELKHLLLSQLWFKHVEIINLYRACLCSTDPYVKAQLQAAFERALMLVPFEPMQLINFYLTMLSEEDNELPEIDKKSRREIEQALRVYFITQLNRCSPAEIQAIRARYFNSRTETVAYRRLRALATQTGEATLSACCALFTNDINQFTIAEIDDTIDKLRLAGDFDLLLENLKGILTVLVYQRDYLAINEATPSYSMVTCGIEEHNIYPIEVALHTDCHVFPARINFASPRNKSYYYNLASCFLTYVELKFFNQDHVNFNYGCLNHSYLCGEKGITKETQGTQLKNTFYVRRHLFKLIEGTEETNPPLLFRSLSVTIQILRSAGVIALVKKGMLDPGRIRILLDENMVSTLDAFNNLQSLDIYDYQHITTLREVLVQSILQYMQKRHKEGEEIESVYLAAFKHPCFNHRTFGFFSTNLLTASQATLIVGYEKLVSPLKPSLHN